MRVNQLRFTFSPVWYSSSLWVIFSLICGFTLTFYTFLGKSSYWAPNGPVRLWYANCALIYCVLLYKSIFNDSSAAVPHGYELLIRVWSVGRMTQGCGNKLGQSNIIWMVNKVRKETGTAKYYLGCKWKRNKTVTQKSKYRQVSNIRRTLVGNKIVDHSDVVGASPVGAAPTTSSFST